MKNPQYDILDAEYCFLMDRITKVFQEKGLNPAIVGGAAVQTHVANLLTKAYNKSLEDLFIDDDIRPQDFIRRTDDIDVAVYNPSLASQETMYRNSILDAVRALECKNVKSPDENDIYDIRVTRIGLKKPILLVESLNKVSNIKMNIANCPSDLYILSNDKYLDMLENSKIIELNYNAGFKPRIRLYSLSDVIATKLSHKRAKDQFDLMVLGKCALMSKEPIDKQRILRLLGESDENRELIEAYLKKIGELV